MGMMTSTHSVGHFKGEGETVSPLSRMSKRWVTSKTHIHTHKHKHGPLLVNPHKKAWYPGPGGFYHPRVMTCNKNLPPSLFRLSPSPSLQHPEWHLRKLTLTSWPHKDICNDTPRHCSDIAVIWWWHLLAEEHKTHTPSKPPIQIHFWSQTPTEIWTSRNRKRILSHH